MSRRVEKFEYSDSTWSFMNSLPNPDLQMFLISALLCSLILDIDFEGISILSVSLSVNYNVRSISSLELSESAQYVLHVVSFTSQIETNKSGSKAVREGVRNLFTESVRKGGDGGRLAGVPLIQ